MRTIFGAIFAAAVAVTCAVGMADSGNSVPERGTTSAWRPGGALKQAAANDERERERQGMKEITRKQFMGGMAATVALGWRGAFAAPARM